MCDPSHFELDEKRHRWWFRRLPTFLGDAVGNPPKWRSLLLLDWWLFVSGGRWRSMTACGCIHFQFEGVLVDRRSYGTAPNGAVGESLGRRCLRGVKAILRAVLFVSRKTWADHTEADELRNVWRLPDASQKFGFDRGSGYMYLPHRILNTVM